MFYELYYNFWSQLVGELGMATEQGVMFAKYGALIFIVISVVLMFKLSIKALNLIFGYWGK